MINAVAIEGVIEKDILDFVEITRDLLLHVQMIEFMPFEGNHWNSKKVITASQMLHWVEEENDMVKLKDEPHATAKKYKAIGHQGTFAFITTMTEHFCGDCNRMRLCRRKNEELPLWKRGNGSSGHPQKRREY